MTFRFPRRCRTTRASMTALTLGLGLLLAARPAEVIDDLVLEYADEPGAYR